MSCLLNDPNFAKFPHNAINDAESFLWVMGYLIIRLKGPGKDNEMTPELRDALEVFGGDAESQLQKLDILNDKEVFHEFLEHVSPEFAVLKELMYAWRRVINLARRFPSGMEFNYPHRALLRGIEDALAKVQAGDGSTGGEESPGRNRDEIRLAIRKQQTCSIRAIKGKDRREGLFSFPVGSSSQSM